MRSSARVAALALALVGAAPAAAIMVGPGVGNVDLLYAQGSKAYNAKGYDKAREAFLKAARANPAHLPTYLALARAYLQSGKRALACYTYRVYVKSSPESGERQKAQSELDLCDKQLAAKPEADDPAAKFAPLKGALHQALDRGQLFGPASAEEVLGALVAADYAAPDLGDLAAKVRTLAEQQAQAAFAAAGKIGARPDELRAGAGAYRLAGEVGADESQTAARAHYLDGCAATIEAKYDAAVEAFRRSLQLGGPQDARFRYGVALWKKGDKNGAVRLLKAELKDDPRTALLVLALALSGGIDAGPAAEALDGFLFEQRFKK